MNYKETKLNIELPSGYTHDTPLQEAQNKIEKATLYLHSIFHLLKTSAVNMESQSQNYDTNGYFWDVHNLSDIGLGIINTIQSAAMVMISPDTLESEKSLAVRLSDLMNNPDLPVEMFNAFQSAFDNLRNELPSEKKEKLEAHELTPEYLETFLSFYPQSNE